MIHLAQALNSFLQDDALVEMFASVLDRFVENDVTHYNHIREIAGDHLTEVLLELWGWRLIIPVRSAKCGEWDSRILLAEPGESYEMPNISRMLVKNARLSGVWDSRKAIYDLFRVMDEAQWEKIPDLVLAIKRACTYYTVSGAGIGGACSRNGLKNKTGHMIAVLKGSGIISPKLMAFAEVARSSSPVYEYNPSVFAELGAF
ncbi:MAG: hypothetical protein SWH54_19125 [Thermodesulfobacteriota bacterium]|nr:hypothetical protein [Thermodesulfobacteriota bacterium]